MTNELKHYGVPGMRWGKRMAKRAVDSSNAASARREQERSANGKARLTDAKGSKAKANSRVVVRTTSLLLASAAGGKLISSLAPGNPFVQAGAAVYSGMVASGALKTGIQDIIDISSTKKD